MDREQWLLDHDREETEVMWDEEDGKEYIITHAIEGQDIEGNVEITKGKKVYLPEFN